MFDFITGPFNVIIVGPLTNLLLFFYSTLGENLGLAIILFTLIVRLLMLPLTIRQIKLQKRMAELQPRLQELQAQRKDATQMNPEEMMLMRQTAGSCLGGCLPLIIQIPILLGLNSVINKIATAQSGDVFNSQLYFDWLKHEASYDFKTFFLGFDLAGVPGQIGFVPAVIPYVILIILLVVTQYYSSILMLAGQKKNTPVKKVKANDPKLTEKEKEKQLMQEEMQKLMQLQTKYMIPGLIGFTAINFNAALGLYWLLQNVFIIVQTYVQFNYFDKKSPAKENKNSAKIHAAEYKDVDVSAQEELVSETNNSTEVSETYQDTKKTKKKSNGKKSKSSIKSGKNKKKLKKK